VASAQRDGVRLVAAVFGGRTGRERDRHMMTILDRGFTAMGVAPRDNDGPVMARGAAGLLARAAQAAPLRLASRNARTAAAVRLPTVRLATGTRAAPRVAAASALRPAAAAQSGVLRRTVRLEQGDGGRRGAPLKAAAPAHKARR